MTVISMVPSWTETLISCGVQVIGRTRYCVHPKTEIPIMGGTKDWDLQKVQSLHPDFILLDKEENPREMYELWPEKCVVTHIEKVEDVPQELDQLSKKFQNLQLADLALRWQKVIDKPVKINSFYEVPGILDWLNKPTGELSHIQYIIWKNPWMAISSETFIASMLKHLGFENKIKTNAKRYFEFDIKDLKKDTLLLFSSEPFPFLKKQEGLRELNFSSAIVDGESYSWFGIRSLEFLEKYK
jgi:ABC-type Fe3+-hydroxamate transport system substrate-binding protein